MSFQSQAHSTATLGRGLELVESMAAKTTCDQDSEDPAAMMAELQRLQVVSLVFLFVWHCNFDVLLWLL